MTIQEKLGLRIRKLRRKRNISQEKLAEISNLHRTYIGAIERGERNVSIVNICRICKALNTDLSELFAGLKC